MGIIDSRSETSQCPPLNLSKADTVILFDTVKPECKWCFQSYKVGQCKPVTIYRFITEDSYEEAYIRRVQTNTLQGTTAAILLQGTRILKSQGSDLSKLDLNSILSRSKERSKKDYSIAEDKMHMNMLVQFEETDVHGSGMDSKQKKKDKKGSLSY